MQATDLQEHRRQSRDRPADPRARNGCASQAVRPKVALHGLDLTVQPGEVFGFLGPNGAGKTTTIKILLGLVHPTSGEARLLGQPAGHAEVRRRVGYLPENFRFHDWLTGAALLEFHARLAGLSATRRRERIPEVLELVGLAGRGDDRIRNYSKGMTQRIGLAQAIIHEPDLVLLDEPTSALDPVGRREVRQLIRSLRAQGMTVFLNSHLLSEVEMVCDRVAIVDQGRVVRSGRLERSGRQCARAERERRPRRSAPARPAHRLWRRHAGPGLHGHPRRGRPGGCPALAAALVEAGYRLYGLVPSHQSLEDLFMSLVQTTSDR